MNRHKKFMKNILTEAIFAYFAESANIPPYTYISARKISIFYVAAITCFVYANPAL